MCFLLNTEVLGPENTGNEDNKAITMMTNLLIDQRFRQLYRFQYTNL